jgi:hypothetical protein
VTDHQAVFPVATMCRVLEVSPSGSYAGQQRSSSARAVRDVHLSAQIAISHTRSDKTYGAPAVRQPLEQRDRRLEERPVVVDVEAPDPKVAEQAFRGAHGLGGDEVGEGRGAARLRTPVADGRRSATHSARLKRSVLARRTSPRRRG